MTSGTGQKNYYELLGLARNATKEQIKEAYREIARVYHPDSHFFDEIVPSAGPTSDEVQVFKQITEAYNTLSNEERRLEYDKILPKDLPSWDEEGKQTWHVDHRVSRAQSELRNKDTNEQPFTWGNFGKVEPTLKSAFDDESASSVRTVSEMISLKRGILAKLRWLFFGR